MRNVPLRHVLCPYSSVAAPTYGGGRPLPCASAARHHSHPENRWLGGSSYPSTWLSEMCVSCAPAAARSGNFSSLASCRRYRLMTLGGEGSPMVAVRIRMAVVLAVVWAIAGTAIAPRAFEARNLLAGQDDPIALADHAVARLLDARIAAREIDAALAVDDADLARSFLDLARATNVPVDPELAERVERANASAATTVRSFGSFARGVLTGEAQDASGLAGVALADLFVLGDIRDALREATRLAAGQDADQ